jgi:hypothetical protein
MSDFTDKTLGNIMYEGHLDESFADDFLLRTDKKGYEDEDREVVSDEIIGRLK